MFGPNTYTALQQGSGHLLVSAPGTSLFGIWWLIGIPCFSVITAALIQGTLQRNYAKSVRQYPQLTIKPPTQDIRSMYGLFTVVGIGAALFFWAVGYTSGSLDLNRSTNTATMTGRMTAFLPAQKRTVPLNLVTDATLDKKPNSRRIRLEVTHGQDLAFPIWSDRPGQAQAVDAINQFLGVNGHN